MKEIGRACEGGEQRCWSGHGGGFVWIEIKMEETVRLSLLAIMDRN